MKTRKSTQNTAHMTPPAPHVHDFDKKVIAKVSKVEILQKFQKAKQPKVAKVQKA